MSSDLFRMVEGLVKSVASISEDVATLKKVVATPSASTNSDYAAALRVLAEWKHPDNRDLNLSFPAFCEQRLNTPVVKQGA